MGVNKMDGIDMLKALYDFKAVYPKTISFDEGEYFILYQTSARQRNWWQVVSMKGNIGFVPSNYVMKVKVEPDFLISFLDSSIESLENFKDIDVNGIISKKELLERLREKKLSLERLYLDNCDPDADDSMSQLESDKTDQIVIEKKPITHHHHRLGKTQGQGSKQTDKKSSCKKSTSGYAIGTSKALSIKESASLHALPSSKSQVNSSQVKLNDGAQDNSVTSEHSETTTNTTTSEDAVTINKRSESEQSQERDANEIVLLTSEEFVPNVNGNDIKADKELNKNPEGDEDSSRTELEGRNNSAEHEKLENTEEDKLVVKSEISEDDKIEVPSFSGDVETLLPRNGIKVESSDVYQIVDIIRHNTNLSFDLSCEALRVVLTSLEQLYNGAINEYLEAVAIHVTDKVDTPKPLLGITHDSKRLQYIFSQLTDCKNDSQQRTWMLYEDEDDIEQFLEELVEILNNADEKITCYEIACDQYQSLINLVQYYQMETRWPIKRLLLKTFTAACHLDRVVVDILLTSVLPVEIVEDMKTNFSDLERFKQLVKMLTIIFSLGQSMPVNHQEYLGVHFVSFLLEIIEGSNPESLVDLVIALVLAFNVQFEDSSQNVVIDAMQQLPTAKVFTEKILLLLNREEDPVKVLKLSTNSTNSVLKMFIDIFSRPDTAELFYTNDSKVLIDILVRQLTDLCAGNPFRRCYLELCRRILRNTNYQEHQHRKQDLMKIFTRIFCEESDCSIPDQQLVREIANEFPQLFKA